VEQESDEAADEDEDAAVQEAISMPECNADTGSADRDSGQAGDVECMLPPFD